MPLLDHIREEKLINLAKAYFDPPPTEAERKILHDSASSEDLPEPDEMAPRPEIRPEFLRWLATEADAAPHIDPKGLRVYAATIPGELNLRNCHVNPLLDFRRCDFRGMISLLSAETRVIYILDSSLAGGIRADGVIVHGPLFLQRINSEGEIRLLAARIEGDLDCSGANLKAKGKALSADKAKIGGAVILKDGFESEGEIRLPGAEITGHLTCKGAKLLAEDYALVMDGAKIGDCVFLTDGFESNGKVRLPGARIDGNFECDGAKLRSKSDALNADGAKIGGSVFLRGAFESEGEIHLLGAEIVGQLSCSGAKLKAKVDALSANGAKIGGEVFLDDGFESEGTIRLLGAEIGGNLLIRGAKVAAVACQNTVIRGDLAWQHIGKSEDTNLNLAGARVKNLRDDRMSWPEERNLEIDGLVYEELTLHGPSSDEDIKAGLYPRELPLTAKERISWLMLQPPDSLIEPEPWMQLRDLLERKGDRKGAKYVLFRFRCLQAREKEFHPLLFLLKLLSWLKRVAIACVFRFKKTLRHVKPYLRHPNRSWAIVFARLEEKPIRICWSITFTLMVGWLIFARAFSSGAMLASGQIQPHAVLSNGESKNSSAPYPLSQSFLYTLENAVPLVKLGIDEKWMPDPKHKPQPWLPQFRWLNWLGWFNSYWFLVWSRVVLIYLGWFQAGVLGMALLRRFKE